jgi:valyl-tRNA synthetase
MNLDAIPPWSEAAGRFELSDAWILSRLNRTVRDVTEALGAYRFHEAAGALYRYMWNDFCDWYLEIAKVRLAAGQSAPKAVVAHALDVLLRLLHPIIPFVTEQLWGQLNSAAPLRGPHDTSAEPMLIRAAWPRAESAAINEHAEERFAAVQELVSGIREARSRHNVPPAKRVAITVAADGEQGQMIADNGTLIGSLARVEPVRVDPAARCGPADATVMAAGIQAFLHDVVDRQAEEAKLTKRRQTLAQGIKGAEGKLANAKFLENAPAEVVGREKQRLAAMRQELEAVEKALSQLQ